MEKLGVISTRLKNFNKWFPICLKDLREFAENFQRIVYIGVFLEINELDKDLSHKMNSWILLFLCKTQSLHHASTE